VEVRVLREPGRGDPSDAQGADREVEAEGSVERLRGLTNRHRRGGGHGRASGHATAKRSRPGAVSVKPAVVRSRPGPLPGEIAPRVRTGDAACAAARDVSSGRSRGTAVRCRAERGGERPTVTLEGAVPQNAAAPTAGRGAGRSGTSRLMEERVEREHLTAALRRVRQHTGSPGIDGMTTEARLPSLREHWGRVREPWWAGTYRPQAGKRQAISKRGGGPRVLGIPTGLDRFIQQAGLHVLQPRFDPTFSEHSDGFRPGRRAQQALAKAPRSIEAGRRGVGDVDREQVFERVTHAVLRGRLAQRLEDKRGLRLMRRSLEAGVMANGVVIERHEGTPQGGPWSPRLAKVLLDDVDKELERRGHACVRDADDCNGYGRSRKAGERGLVLLRKPYGHLRWRINAEKSAVARGITRELLGIAFWRGAGGKRRRRGADKALEAMKNRGREITGRSRGRSVRQVVEELSRDLTGWRASFGMAETPEVCRSLDEWIRHRLRPIHLKHWTTATRAQAEFRARGASEALARRVGVRCQRWWYHSTHAAHVVLTQEYFDGLGVPRLATCPHLPEPPDADPHVRWCGRGRKTTIPIRCQRLRAVRCRSSHTSGWAHMYCAEHAVRDRYRCVGALGRSATSALLGRDRDKNHGERRTERCA
jgi:group II intron reverse transcriptase/maturase